MLQNRCFLRVWRNDRKQCFDSFDLYVLLLLSWLIHLCFLFLFILQFLILVCPFFCIFLSCPSSLSCSFLSAAVLLCPLCHSRACLAWIVVSEKHFSLPALCTVCSFVPYSWKEVRRMALKHSFLPSSFYVTSIWKPPFCKILCWALGYLNKTPRFLVGETKRFCVFHSFIPQIFIRTGI